MDATEAAIHQTLDEWEQALSRGDREKLSDLMSEHLVHTDPMGLTHTRDELIAALASPAALHNVSVTKDDVRVQVYGATAVVTGRTCMEMDLGGQVRRGAFRFTDVLVHDGRRWTIVATHTTGISGPAA